MKKISLKRVLAFTSIATVLLISILSQMNVKAYSIEWIINNRMGKIVDGLIVFVFMYIILGIYDLFKDSKKSGIIDLLCAGAFAVLRMKLTYHYSLWSEAGFIILFLIFAIFSVSNIIYVIKNHNEKNVIIDIIISIVLFTICSGIIFIPVMQMKKINNENFKALTENIDAIWKGEDKHFYLVNKNDEFLDCYDVLDENLKKEKSINTHFEKYGILQIYSGEKSSTIGIGYDNEDKNCYVYNNCLDKVCKLKSLEKIDKYKSMVRNRSYLEELLTQAKKSGMIEYDELKQLMITEEECLYDEFFSDGSEIVYKDGEYYGYKDADGHTHVNEKDEFIVNIYDKYRVTYFPLKHKYEIISKEDSEDRREYDFVMPYNNFMVCCREDRYEILSTDDLNVLFKMDINYGEDYNNLTSKDFLDERLINVYADESVILLDNYGEDGECNETLIRFDKEEKTAEFVDDNIRGIVSWDAPYELPNILYTYGEIFDVAI